MIGLAVTFLDRKCVVELAGGGVSFVVYLTRFYINDLIELCILREANGIVPFGDGIHFGTADRNHKYRPDFWIVSLLIAIWHVDQFRSLGQCTGA